MYLCLCLVYEKNHFCFNESIKEIMREKEIRERFEKHVQDYVLILFTCSYQSQ